MLVEIYLFEDDEHEMIWSGDLDVIPRLNDILFIGKEDSFQVDRTPIFRLDKNPLTIEISVKYQTI